MMYKTDHIAWAAEAVAVFQEHCRTGDEHAIADLICDLGHLAEERGLDFLNEVKRGIGHWYAEHHAGHGEVLGPTPRSRSSSSLNSRLRRWVMNCLQRAFAVLPFRRGGRQYITIPQGAFARTG
jgi:hypothetical protein